MLFGKRREHALTDARNEEERGQVGETEFGRAVDTGAERVPHQLLDLHAPRPRGGIFPAVEPFHDPDEQIHLPAGIDAHDRGERVSPGEELGPREVKQDEALRSRRECPRGHPREEVVVQVDEREPRSGRTCATASVSRRFDLPLPVAARMSEWHVRCAQVRRDRVLPAGHAVCAEGRARCACTKGWRAQKAAEPCFAFAVDVLKYPPD